MHRSVWPLLLLGAFGCHKDAPPASPPAAPNAAPTVAPADTPSPAGGLVGELQRQALDRPKGTVTVEQVLMAIGDAGVKLEPHKQVLATALRAHYCEVASTTAGLGMSICEYDDLAQAKAGRERSETQFAAFGKRTLVLNEKTLLSLNPIEETPAVAAEKVKIVALFGKLSAK